MKKNKGGYVLIYVLVVFILLGLACTAVCTFALNGLKTQRAALETDKQRYAAEGIVEQVVARLLDGEKGVTALTDGGYESEELARNALETAYGTLIDGLESNTDGLTENNTEATWSPDYKTCVFETTITAEKETKQIKTMLRMELGVAVTSYLEETGEMDPDTDEPISETRYRYAVSSANLSYADYQVVVIEPEGGDEP